MRAAVSASTQTAIGLILLVAPPSPAMAQENPPTPSPVTIETMPADACAPDSRNRPVQVFLPPGYADDPGARYPVLYANDGQDMGAWQLRETLARLIAEGAVQPLIAVAIPAGPARLHEYGIAGTPNAKGLGDEAADYGRWVLEVLKPCIDSRYRTRTGPGYTAVMGASLGGLSAFDLAWNHPEVFGAAGAFSASFWWRTDDRTPARQQSSRIAHRMVRHGPRSTARFWFEAGAADETADRDRNGTIDAIQDVTELMDELRRRGYEEGRDMMYVEVAGGHNPTTWAAVLPAFLAWAFPAVKGER
jgi:enterochelin esterase-like enzyme